MEGLILSAFLYKAGMETFDVIVLGAGLNGLAVALALGGRKCRTPLQVAVVDRGDPILLASASSASRASALTHATQEMIRGLGVWEGISSHLQPMQSIVVSDSKEGAERDSLLSFLFPISFPSFFIHFHTISTVISNRRTGTDEK